MKFDIDKLKFKAKLAGDGLMDFGFITDRKGFFDWCAENNILSSLSRHKNGASEDFYSCQILEPMKFNAKHIRHDEFPEWHCEFASQGPGTMLVSLEYIPYAWPSIVEEDENGS